MKYVVIDIETDILNEDVGKFKADPNCRLNEIVMVGYRPDDLDEVVTVDTAPGITQNPPIYPPPADTIVVGQNIAFDLMYLLRWPEWQEWAKEGIIWDTCIVHYLMSGQDEKFVNLDILSLKAAGASEDEIDYFKSIKKLKAQVVTLRSKGTTADKGRATVIALDIGVFMDKWKHVLKDDKIKEYWQAGINTRSIPAEELREYLIGDVNNTLMVFEQQLREADYLELLPLIHVQMEARMATLEMQRNGMYVQQQVLSAQHNVLQGELNEIENLILEDLACMAKVGDQAIVEQIKPGSNKFIGAALFGGDIEVTVRRTMRDEDGEVVKFKSGAKKGEQRTKLEKEVLSFPPLLEGDAYTKRNARGDWAVADDVLKAVEKLSSPFSTARASAFASRVRQYRELKKDISVYYVGYGSLVWPHDHCIHPTFQHTSTDTGRLSCTKPNLQQVSGK